MIMSFMKDRSIRFEKISSFNIIDQTIRQGGRDRRARGVRETRARLAGDREHRGKRVNRNTDTNDLLMNNEFEHGLHCSMLRRLRDYYR